jgi:hypothetical protein
MDMPDLSRTFLSDLPGSTKDIQKKKKIMARFPAVI